MAIRKISIVGSGVFGIMYGHFLASHFPRRQYPLCRRRGSI